VNVPARLAAFAAALVVAGVLGAAVGGVAGPLGTEPEAPHGDGHAPAADPGSGHGPAGASEGGHAPAADPGSGHGAAGASEDGHGEGHGAAGEAPGRTSGEGGVGGLALADQGYRLDLRTPTLAPGDATVELAVVGPDGHPVTAVDEVHERPLHLVVVGRDLVGYHHVHPRPAADGTWSAAVPGLAPGSYRVVADLRPTGGPALALAADLAVTGTPGTAALPAPGRTATAGDLTVVMAGRPALGRHDLAFTVRRGGEAVTPDPYLGARGHLVAIRRGDMGYVHVHPHEGAGAEVAFTASFPTAGTYRLFLDLSVGGEVRTAAFTVVIPEGASHG
jgi:hypothetical protein